LDAAPCHAKHCCRTGAIARAQAALAADPRNVDKIIKLGLAQSGARQYREAIATLTRGLAIAPDNAVLLRWRGHRYLSVREFDRAATDLTRGSRIDSTIYGIWYHLGAVRYSQGDFAGAADAFARAMLARRPDSLPATNAYVQRLRLYRGEIGPSEVFTPADTADVQIATLSYRLGNWHLVRGDTVNARRWFERSVSSGGWPGFGFIVSEAELRRLR